MKNFYYILFTLLLANNSYGQADTVRNPDSTPIKRELQTKIGDIQSNIKKPADSIELSSKEQILKNDSLWMQAYLEDSVFQADSIRKTVIVFKNLSFIDTGTYKRYQTHPFLPLHTPGIFRIIDYRIQASKDELFYLMAGVIFLLAFIRAVFSKYFKNLFLLFFQSSLRQKQNREQLLQNNIASLFINLLFFISAGLFISLLIKYQNWASVSYWWLALYCGMGLGSVYLVKYLFLLFAGWVFNAKEAAASYIFLVFMVNKIMGIILIPFLLVLSFAKTDVIEAGIIISYIIIGFLYVYRYLLSFGTFRNKLKVNGLHFFLYLCAVELLPLLLIYKGLIVYTAGSF